MEHIVGYKIKCSGLKNPQSVAGSNFDECLRKFREYWSADYDIDTDIILSAEPITVRFDIDDE